ncbi:Oidioi.mRNA.OKI2018_I69.PAR.g9971.t1.cds [Oikopleura dioica]|uniref:Oidioi.mRNA.OKI2018_I69.PAR.g9971.t1.cds n=1 Tax=Oikopleura dioica TaxID=34765 RepID=A0ABN7RN83_OIKDI|nr:Oidioi.mRNA.OKI2018_I69.PAR.g9971.t1.cds [Oikopleura dioica]
MPKQPTIQKAPAQPYPTGGRSIRAPEFQHRGIKSTSTNFTPQPAFSSTPTRVRKRELRPAPYVPMYGQALPDDYFFPKTYTPSTYSLTQVEDFNDAVDEEEEENEQTCGMVKIWMMEKIDKQDKTIESLRNQLEEAKEELTKLKENTKDCICTLP